MAAPKTTQNRRRVNPLTIGLTQSVLFRSLGVEGGVLLIKPCVIAFDGPTLTLTDVTPTTISGDVQFYNATFATFSTGVTIDSTLGRLHVSWASLPTDGDIIWFIGGTGTIGCGPGSFMTPFSVAFSD